MNLKKFEGYVEAKILDRGLSYYENDCIDEVEQVGDNEYSAVAYGSDEYNIFIKMDDDENIVEHSCDCPYDWGNICKHEVAMLYFLKNSVKNGVQIKYGKSQDIKDDLEKLSKKELVDIIFNLSKRNRDFKQEIGWALGHY